MQRFCEACAMTWTGPYTDCPGCQAQAGMLAVAELRADKTAMEERGDRWCKVAGELEAELDTLRRALETLEIEWREAARLARPLDCAPLTADKRARIATWMHYTTRANELRALLSPSGDLR